MISNTSTQHVIAAQKNEQLGETNTGFQKKEFNTLLMKM